MKDRPFDIKQLRGAAATDPCQKLDSPKVDHRAIGCADGRSHREHDTPMVTMPREDRGSVTNPGCLRYRRDMLAACSKSWTRRRARR